MTTNPDRAKEKIVLSWSGGKDSAMALHELRTHSNYEVVSLLTTVTEDFDRISMHGVRRALLEQQAESLGVPLRIVYISKGASNEEYQVDMGMVLKEFLDQGVKQVAFGDLFLEDIRKYRESQLSQLKMTGIFPIWKRDTSEMAKTFIALGYKAVICCVDPKVINASFAGQYYDENFLDRLPTLVDPCGENGEFHSFVFDGPLFRKKISLEIGEIVLRDSFYFCDLVPKGER